MADARKAPKPIKDVAHPDETAPDPSSKPIIVTNRPIMKDPMMAEGAEPLGDMDNSENVKVTVHKAELKLTAPEPPAPTEPAPTQSAQPGTAVTPAEEVKPEPPASPTPATPPPAKTPEAVQPPEPPAAEEPAEETKADNDTPDAAAIEEAEAAKQAEHDAAIQKLVDSKQYYLTINAIEKRRSQRIVVLGVVLSLLLAVAWVDIALDAGLVQISGIKPVTHFFSN